MVSEFYPGWNIRLYYDLEDTDPLLSDLCEVACKDANIDLCHVKNIPALGDVSQVFAMNWRFFPMLDPQVSIIHITTKCKDANFMRDHPAHSIEILLLQYQCRLVIWHLEI